MVKEHWLPFWLDLGCVRPPRFTGERNETSQEDLSGEAIAERTVVETSPHALRKTKLPDQKD